MVMFSQMLPLTLYAQVEVVKFFVMNNLEKDNAFRTFQA
jgi:hypothetical protein